MEDKERMLNAKEVAERLQIAVITAQRWLHAGHIQGTKLPGRAGWRVAESEVERFLREGARQ